MKILFGLLYEMDGSMQFMYLFLTLSMITLAILHPLMKKHEKIWAALCGIPLVVYIIFILTGYYAGNLTLTMSRYGAFALVALVIAMWGVEMLLKRSYVATTIIVFLFSAVVLLGNVVAIWAVWLRPNVANYSRMGWAKSFEKTVDYLEKEYILNDWKEIDYAKIRAELLPKMKSAEARGDELSFVEALYELKYEINDGHFAIRGDVAGRDAAMRRLAGNDYGFSLFRAKTGEIVAILVDKECPCYELGIHDGTVITKWNDVPIEEAVKDVKCIDRLHEFQTLENIRIAQPIFLAGLGGDLLDVSFRNEEGVEETLELTPCGDYIDRRTTALEILFGDNVISKENYSTSMLSDNIGYLRITEEEYSANPLFIAKGTIEGFSQKMYDELDAKLEKLRKQGMDRIIVDIRNNDGGNGFESRTVASLFTSSSCPYYLTLYKKGEFKVVSEAKPLNGGKWSEIPIVVLVNGQTVSAGETITNYMKGSKNVTVIGNTTTWGSMQGTGGSTVLTNSKYEVRFPITPVLGADGLPAVDVKADRRARLTLDYQMQYSVDEAVEFFQHPGEDMVLEAAIEYIQGLK